MKAKEIIYKTVKQPVKDAVLPIGLTDETLQERKEKVITKMKEEGLDKIIVYCDVEHAWNFAYLVGYYTRFEEGLLIMDQKGNMTLVLGNESLNKGSKARFQCNIVHVSLFSLPNQPNRNDKSFVELLKEAGLKEGERTGIIGWKNFTSKVDPIDEMFEVPSYIVDSVKNVLGDAKLLVNATRLFLGENGVRTTNNANEIAHYEYGAALASDCVLDAMNLVEEGVSELGLGDALVRYGQHTTITTIASTGERFVKANMFPLDRKVKLGDPVSLSVGYQGGSSSRAGYMQYQKQKNFQKQQKHI